MSDFTRFGTHNMVLPPEGPKVFTNKLDFREKATAELDFLALIQRNTVSYIQGFYVDNSLNANVLYIEADQTGHRLPIPAGHAGYLPMFISDSAILRFVTVPAGDLTVQFIATNIPVHPYLWKVTP